MNLLKHTKNLAKIGKNIYSILGGMTVEYSPSSEPIAKENRYNLKYKRLRKNFPWGKRAFDCAWLKFTGSKPEKGCVAIIDIVGEAMIYDKNNNIVASITSIANSINKMQPLRGKLVVDLNDMENDFQFFADCSFNGVTCNIGLLPLLLRADIAKKSPIFNEFYYSYRTLFETYTNIKDKTRQAEINAVLLKAMDNFNNPQEAIKILNTEINDDKSSDVLNFTAIGHGHLDLAWLWPLRESRRKASRTLVAQLSNIKNHEGYVYGVSQPQQLIWVKDNEPELYQEVKKAFLNGSLEPQGGFWTECDCNLVSGESFIRQAIYGQKFWKEEIGVDVKTCWLPDVFGFSPALPQIIKGCGMDSFFTIKLTWNSVNSFPHKSFNWIGIDGTSVLSHMAPEGDYTCNASPKININTKNQYIEKDIAPVALVVYGVGDGGCGPSEGHMEMIKRENHIKDLTSINFGTAQSFFDKLRVYQDKLPNYNGELYLETHQGTFTTQAKNKKYNRKMEFKLHNVEFLSAQMRAKGLDVNKYDLEEIWKEVLLYQFHDILPGSSINRVYKESLARYAEIDKQLNKMISEMATELGAEEGLFNACPAIKEEIICISGKTYLASAEPYDFAKITELNAKDLITGDKTLENRYLRLIFGVNGEIVSCFDKLNNHETVKGSFNNLTVYSDPIIIFNAWNIAPCYEKLPKKDFKLKSFSTEIKDGAIVRTNNYIYHKSTLTQRIILKSSSKIVEFDTEVSWHESNKMLRANFYPADYGDKAICDCAFGYKEYATTENNSIDKAKFEISAHKFIATEKDGFGFALLNDCKYGYKAKNGVISMNLLRSPFNPDPKADRGDHSFKYAIYPYMGDIVSADVQGKAYAFNNDFLPFKLDVKQIISLNNSNIIIETLKPQNDGDGIIVRLYEKTGTNQNCNISAEGYKIYLTDMIECGKKECGVDLSFHKFEVKTLLLIKRS